MAMPPDSETLCAMRPAVTDINAAIMSALKVPEGFSCMRRIILGRGAFVTSIIMRHMCFRALLVASIGGLRYASQKIGIFCVFFHTWIVANFEFDCYQFDRWIAACRNWNFDGPRGCGF